MTEYVLVAISADDVGSRPVINTGVSMVGMAGNDYFCGHCGRKMMHDFDLSRMQADMAYQCGGCGNYNINRQG